MCNPFFESDYINDFKFHFCFNQSDPIFSPMSIMSDKLTPSNGDKWELMHYVLWVSSYLPPLGGVGASDMIEIALAP